MTRKNPGKLVPPEFKSGDYLPITWPGFTRPEGRGRGMKDQERPSAKQLNYAHSIKIMRNRQTHGEEE